MRRGDPTIRGRILPRLLTITLVAALLPLASVARSSDEDDTRRDLARKLYKSLHRERKRSLRISAGACGFTQAHRPPPTHEVSKLIKIPFRRLDMLRSRFVERGDSLFLEFRCGNDEECIVDRRVKPIRRTKSKSSHRLKIDKRGFYKQYKNNRDDAMRDLRRLIRFSRRRCGKG